MRDVGGGGGGGGWHGLTYDVSHGQCVTFGTIYCTLLYK